MIQLTKDDLQYSNYTWNIHTPNASKISGRLDDTRFNKNDGYEVLYLINKLAELWDLSKIESGKKIERIIAHKLPTHIKTQTEVATWIQMNWKTITITAKQTKQSQK